MTSSVVLITGAARRVGAGLARDLAASGCRVAVHFRSGAEDAARVVADIRADGGAAESFRADLTQDADRRRLIDEVVGAFGRIDVLVNNASTFAYDTFQTMTTASWDAHIADNLTAPVMLARAFADAVEPEASGVIVNILDQKVLAPNPDFFTYTAGKVALAGLTETLALALAPRIRVVGVAPGLLLPSGEQTQADFERAWVDTPLGRGPDIADVARTVRFVIDTPSVTGRIIAVDGGESLVRRARDVAFDGV
ncbi:SDR family oxidoreductase [Brevundimonas sp. VNH65]|uniref:SDR family oxidoreductase n=1 Tax=Brevundimonas sp. VNH65 TaxID=3400917 RepID=UPI003C012B31